MGDAKETDVSRVSCKTRENYVLKVHAVFLHPVPFAMASWDHRTRHFLMFEVFRGADKSLARPGRKQSTATEDFDVHMFYL